MKTGSLRCSLALPDYPLGSQYSPDGLSETDIDALLAQEGIDVDEPSVNDAAPIVPMRPDSQSRSAAPTGRKAA